MGWGYGVYNNHIRTPRFGPIRWAHNSNRRVGVAQSGAPSAAIHGEFKTNLFVRATDAIGGSLIDSDMTR